MDDRNLGYLLTKYFRPIMITVGVVIAACLVGIIAVIIHNLMPEKTLVSINVAPTEATVTIDGREYHNGTYEIKPGQYQVSISADGFDPKIVNLDIKPHQTTPLSTYLVNKKEGLAYFEKSAADLQVLNSITDQEIQDFMQQYRKKISIKDQLPISVRYNAAQGSTTEGRSLDFQTVSDGTSRSDCSMAFCLLVSATYGISAPDEASVRAALSNLGYNYDDYEVIYDM